jgi:sulfite exporter TauE/SafE
MQEFTLITAFTVGLLGGVHCIGMCGGIVGALSFATQASSKKSMMILLSYNLGRLSSYTLAGALMGGLGWLAAYWLDIRYLQVILQLIAGIFMVLLGLYLSGWWMVLVRLEKVGGVVWRYIQPLSKKVMPVENAHQAILLGLLWGWLPCGLVYSVLIWSMSAGSMQHGALLMLCFGLGTLPNLLAMGLFAEGMRHWVSHVRVRRLSGGLVICFGLWQLALVMLAL